VVGLVFNKTAFTSAEKKLVEQFCSRVKGRHIILTDSKKYVAVSLTGNVFHYSPPNIEDTHVSSLTGAGDATAAALVETLVASVSRSSGFDPCDESVADDFRLRVDDYVKRTLRASGATPGSDFRFTHDESLEDLPLGRQLLIKVRRFIIEHVLKHLSQILLWILILLVIIAFAPSKRAAVRCWQESKEITDVVKCILPSDTLLQRK
jgi:hypothetical protein